MVVLNFPVFDYKIRMVGQKKEIFDIVRKKFVALTPEEWVRQHAINYLIVEKHIPAALISVEKGLMLDRMHKRTDVVVFNREGKPVILVECKSPFVAIDELVMAQAAAYHSRIQVKYILLTNGVLHVCSFLDTALQQVTFLPELPGVEHLPGF